MTAPHRASAGFEAIDILLVFILLACGVVIAQYGISTIRRHRQKRRAWLRERDRRQP